MEFGEYSILQPTDITCEQFIYTLVYYLDGVEKSLPSFITFNSGGETNISIFTVDPAFIGTYQLSLFVRLNDYVNESYPFTLEVLNACRPTRLITPTQSLFHTFRLGSPALVIPILPFIPDVTCD